ncbi:MBL fold metallo-hydrolase [Nitrospira moscoviensis]|nr:MBL fold metallo-hydrolase [Nitrospira moscoviensis]
MRVTILGSGTNLHPTRAAAGYLVRTDQTLLFDFGPRTLTNLLKTGVDRHAITHILFSHFHADHCSDFLTFFFDAQIVTKYQGGTRGPLTVIGPHGTERLFRTLFETLPGFTEPRFAVRFKEVSDRPFKIGDTTIRPRTVTHSPDLHCLGYRVEYGGKAVAYSGDSEYCENLVRLCGDADAAILDCSYPANRPGPVHLHAGQCGQVAREAAATRLILSHFYPLAERYDVTAQAAEEFGGRITKASDLMTIRL